MKVIGERWSKLDIDLKKQYVHLAAKEKIRYDQEMVIYRKKTENQGSVIEQQQAPPVLAEL
jgi:hypothetical protein